MAEVEEVAAAAAERPDGVAEALVELAGLLLDEEGLPATLERVVDLAVRSIPGCAGAGVTLEGGQGFTTVAYSHPLVLAVDQAQYDAGDGPCICAHRQQEVLRVDVSEAAQRWPAFAAAARRAGIRSFLAAPLPARRVSLGSLNLYSHDANGFDALDETLIALFVGQVAVSLANARLYASTRALSGQLEEALASRGVIDQAKGVLMARQGVDADGAFQLLRRRSQLTNTKLREVAAAIVAETASAPGRAPVAEQGSVAERVCRPPDVRAEAAADPLAEADAV